MTHLNYECRTAVTLHAWLELCDERQLSDTCQFLRNVLRQKLFEVTPQRLLDVCEIFTLRVMPWTHR